MPEPHSQTSNPQAFGSAADSEDPTHDSLTRDQLLAEVLRETLSLNRQDPSRLLQSLSQWRLTLDNRDLDRSLCAELVREVLRQRLGDESMKISPRLYHDVGTVLWNDPASRVRMRRLWHALGDPT